MKPYPFLYSLFDVEVRAHPYGLLTVSVCAHPGALPRRPARKYSKACKSLHRELAQPSKKIRKSPSTASRNTSCRPVPAWRKHLASLFTSDDAGRQVSRGTSGGREPSDKDYNAILFLGQIFLLAFEQKYLLAYCFG